MRRRFSGLRMMINRPPCDEELRLGEAVVGRGSVRAENDAPAPARTEPRPTTEPHPSPHPTALASSQNATGLFLRWPAYLSVRGSQVSQ